MSEHRSVHVDRFSGPGMPRLLLVDDDEMLRRSSERFLTRAGFDVTTAASGAEALQMLEQGMIVDAFVIDLEMPEMNGIELMRCLDEVARDIPRGLWSASQDLSNLSEEDLALAWFVKNKRSPIGDLVQATCQAIYGPGRPRARDQKKRRRRTRSGHWRCADEPAEAQLTPESAAPSVSSKGP